MAAPQIMDDASSRSRVDWFFKVYILQRSAPTEVTGGCFPNKKFGPGATDGPVAAELRTD